MSLPPKLAEPVLENVPATVGTKLTVMTQVWPPGKLARLQLETPARNRTIPPQLALAYETAENRPSALPLRSVLLAHSTAFLLSPKPSCSKISGEDLLLRGSFRASFRVCASSTTVPLEARLFSLHLSKRASRPAGMSGSRSIDKLPSEGSAFRSTSTASAVSRFTAKQNARHSGGRHKTLLLANSSGLPVLPLLSAPGSSWHCPPAPWLWGADSALRLPADRFPPARAAPLPGQIPK